MQENVHSFKRKRRDDDANELPDLTIMMMMRAMITLMTMMAMITTIENDRISRRQLYHLYSNKPSGNQKDVHLSNTIGTRKLS